MIACMKWFAMVHQLGAPSCPLVLMGVIGDPVMTRWRTLMRLQILKMMDLVEGVQFDVRFVVAKMDHCPRSTLETLGCNSTSGPPLETCAALQRENEEHRDIVQLRFASHSSHSASKRRTPRPGTGRRAYAVTQSTGRRPTPCRTVYLGKRGPATP